MKERGSKGVVGALSSVLGVVDKVDGADAIVGVGERGAKATIASLFGVGRAREQVDGKAATVNAKVSGAAGAVSELAGFESARSRVDGKDATVEAKVGGIAAAVAGLMGFERARAAADGKDIDVQGDFDGAGGIAGMLAFRAAAAGVTAGMGSMGSGVSAGGVRIAMIGGIAATAAALFSPLLGVLASVGSLGAAAGAGIGLIAAPLAMVIGKLTDYHEGLKEAGAAQETATSTAQAYATAQGAVEDAQRKVAQTAADGAAAIAKAEAVVEQARDDGTEAIEQKETDLARTRVDSAQAVEDAETSLERIREDVAANNAQAEQGLTDARNELELASYKLLQTEEELADIQDGDEERSQAQATDDLTRARLDLTEARRRENEAIKEYGANSLEAKQAALDVSQAERDLAAQTEETNEIRANGSEELQAAEQARDDAIRNQTAARQNVQDKEEAYDRTRLEGIRSIDDAEQALFRANVARNRDVGDAIDAVSQAEQDRTEAVSTAQAALTEQYRTNRQAMAAAKKAVTDAEEAATVAAKAASAAQADLASKTKPLPPALMALYNAAMRFGDAANRQFGEAQNAVARFGVGVLRDAKPALDVLGDASVATIGGLSRAWDGFVSRLKMPTQQASVGTLLGITPQVIQSLVSGVGDLLLALTNMFASAAPSAVSLARAFQSAMRALLAWSGSTSGVNAVKAATAAAIPVFRALWGMVKQVGGALFDFGVTNAPAIATAIRIVSGALTFLIRGFSWLTRVFGPIVPIAAALTPVFLGVALVLGNLIGLFAPLGAFIGTFIAYMGGWIATGSALVAFLGGPWGLAIAAVIAGVVLLIRHFGGVRGAFAALKNAVGPAISVLKNLGAVVKGLFTGDTGAERFKKAFASLPKPIQDALRNIYQAWLKLRIGLQRVGNQIKPIISAVGNGIQKGLGTAFRFLSGQVRQLWNAFKQAWPGIKKAVLPVLTAIANGIKKGAGAAFRFLLSQAKVVVNWFKKNWPLIQRTAEVVFDFLKRHVTTTIRQVWNIIRSVVTQIVKFFRANWGTVENIFEAVWKIIKTTVSTAIKAVLGIIKAVMQAITGDWKGAWNTIKGVVSMVLKAMKSNIDNVTKIIVNVLKLAWNALKSLTGAAWNFLKRITSSAWETIKNYIGDKIQAARERAGQIVQDLKSGLSGAWDAIKSAASEAWTAISGAIWRPVETAYNRVVEFIDKIKGAVNAVLRLVGLPELGGSSSGNSGAPSPGGNGSSGRGSRPVRARGPRRFARGGITDPKDGYGVVGEAGEREAVVNLERRTPESRDALRAANRSPNARGHRSGEGGKRRRRPGFRGAESADAESADAGAWYKHVADANAEAARKWPSLAIQPGTPGADGDPGNSTDFYPGAIGEDVSGEKEQIGNEVVSWLESAKRQITDYIIWNGQANYGQGWEAYTGGAGYPTPVTVNDKHLDHVHWEATKGESGTANYGGSFGGGSVDPRAAIFEAAWERLVQRPIVDPILGPLKNADYALTRAAGAAAQKIPDGIKGWISSKLGSSGSGGFSGGGDPAKNRALGEKMFPSTGLSGQWSDVEYIWNQESGFDHTADNPDSSAYGIPQGLTDLHDMPKGYGPPGGDPAVQMGWGFDYIKERYGNTGEARAYKEANGTYDTGGFIKRDHTAELHKGEIAMPLTRPHVQNTFAALGMDDLRNGITGELQGLRQDMKEAGIKVSGYGEEAQQVIVVGARQGGLGAMESGDGRRIIKGQGSVTGRLDGLSDLVRR